MEPIITLINAKLPPPAKGRAHTNPRRWLLLLLCFFSFGQAFAQGTFFSETTGINKDITNDFFVMKQSYLSKNDIAGYVSYQIPVWLNKNLFAVYFEKDIGTPTDGPIATRIEIDGGRMFFGVGYDAIATGIDPIDRNDQKMIELSYKFSTINGKTAFKGQFMFLNGNGVYELLTPTANELQKVTNSCW